MSEKTSLLCRLFALYPSQFAYVAHEAPYVPAKHPLPMVFGVLCPRSIAPN